MTDTESVLSATTKTDDPEESIAEMTNEELVKHIEQIRHFSEILEIETSMLDRFSRRMEPTSGSARLHSASSSQHSAGQESLFSRNRRKGAKYVKAVESELIMLSPEQKCDIAQRELEQLREDMDKQKKDSLKIIDNLKANNEEAEVRLEELKKSMYEFNRDICRGAIHFKTKTVMAEKVERFFEEKFKAMSSYIDKIKLKNATIRVQRRNIMRQLRQKEEMGEILHEVDYQQLKIENSQYLEKIDEKNHELLRLKLMAANSLQVLTHFRKKLNFLLIELESLNDDIRSKKGTLIRFRVESVEEEEERAHAEKINIELRRRLTDYRVPANIKYVNNKAELRELHYTVRSWERKVEIVQMALRNHRKAWQQIWTQGQQGAAWMRSQLRFTPQVNVLSKSSK